MNIKCLFPLIILAVALAFIGCEGPEGPQGPAGPQGPEGPPGVAYTYLGDNANACGMCHSYTVGTWSETGHHEAYDALVADGEENDPYCLQCHTTGFDAVVAYGDTAITSPGPDLFGFDDYWPPQNSSDSARMEALENVQCEACHGSAGNPDYHALNVTFETQEINGVEMSMCAKCHEQLDEWYESGHGLVLTTHNMTMEEFNDEWNAGGNPASTSDCWTCHTGEGFAGRYDSEYAIRPEMATLVGCPACHDPHDNSIEYQLRTEADFSVVFDTLYYPTEYTMTGYGSAQLCAQCHHDRRTNSTVLSMINGTYSNPSRFGSHHSNQMDEFIGAGSYEIADYTYDREHPHQSLTSACVSCHMYSIGFGEPGGPVYGHNFEANLLACEPCHGTQTNFDINSFQTEVQSKLDSLIALICVDPDSIGYPSLTTTEERMAGWAYKFVENDGSLGVHNPDYTMSLLDNAIDFLNSLSSKNKGLAQK